MALMTFGPSQWCTRCLVGWVGKQRKTWDTFDTPQPNVSELDPCWSCDLTDAVVHEHWAAAEVTVPTWEVTVPA